MYPHHDKDWLMEELANSEDIEEVADAAGVSPDTIETWIEKHGIQHSTEQPVSEDEESSETNDDSDTITEETMTDTNETETDVEEESTDDSTAQRVATEGRNGTASGDESVEPEEVVTEVQDTDANLEVEEDTVTDTAEEDSDLTEEQPSEVPEDVDTLGVGDCQCCGREELLREHNIAAGEIESVCDDCWEHLVGMNINTKRTVINNPTVPHWSVQDE